MDHRKTVSIVSPCYNAAKYLKRYFESVISQTYQYLELIVVNDGSEDNSEEIIKSYEEELHKAGILFKYVSYPENKGQAYALNEGLKYVTGEYLTWPDVDDEMTADCIEKKVSFLDSNPDCDYCVCNSVSIDSSNNKSVVYKPQVFSDKKAITESLIFTKKGYFVCGAYMVRTSFFDKVVPGRTLYTGRGGQNAQMLIPISWKGNPGYIDEILYRFYVHADSHSHSIDEPKKHVNQLQLFQKIIVETIRKTGDPDLIKYTPEVEKHYSRLRFGHSLDSKDPVLIKQCAEDLKRHGELSLHDRYLVFRYTNALAKKIFPV